MYLAALAEPLDDSICFHCQQAAEKLLKALIVASDFTPPRTHDLEALASLLAPPQPIPADIEDAFAYLTEMAIIPRYPVQADLRSPERAERARCALDNAIEWVTSSYGWEIRRRPMGRVHNHFSAGMPIAAIDLPLGKEEGNLKEPSKLPEDMTLIDQKDGPSSTRG